jgi:hypothetical protein
MSSRAALPLAFRGSPRGSPRSVGRRCFSPTSATDIRHVHPWTVRFPGMRLSPSPTDTAPCCDTPRGVPQRVFRGTGAELPCGNAAPDRCALDGVHRASAPPLTAPTHFWARPSTTPGGAPVPRLCRPRARLTADASDAPCRAPRVPGNPSLFRGTRTASTAHASTRAA